MRIKKDPGIRREVFIKAATELFIEKGYDAVSVRGILAAVADKSASPSVFYYYFESKDDLYHACIEGIASRYIEGFREHFSVKFDTVDDWLLSHVNYMRNYLTDYLTNERNIMMTGSSVQNRMFILDMREKVTMQVADLWTESLSDIGLYSYDEAKKLSRFLAGGISEMIYNYMLEASRERSRSEQLIKDIIHFSAITIGLTDAQKKLLLSVM